VADGVIPREPDARKYIQKAIDLDPENSTAHYF
jgi:hypothetical protein